MSDGRDRNRPKRERDDRDRRREREERFATQTQGKTDRDDVVEENDEKVDVVVEVNDLNERKVRDLSKTKENDGESDTLDDYGMEIFRLRKIVRHLWKIRTNLLNKIEHIERKANQPDDIENVFRTNRHLVKRKRENDDDIDQDRPLKKPRVEDEKEENEDKDKDKNKDKEKEKDDKDKEKSEEKSSAPKRRGGGLFQNLFLGTLQSAKKQVEKERDLRIKVEKKVQQKIEADKAKLKQKENERFEKMKEDIQEKLADIESQLQKEEELLMEKIQERQEALLSNFSLTKTEPQVYYRKATTATA